MNSTQTMRLQVDIGVLHQCVEKELSKADLIISNWRISPFSIEKKNFTTAGLYQVRGNAKSGEIDYPWSLFLKIIQPESEEKNDQAHFNYWKREALVYQSGVLNHLPPLIQTPKCYVVEEKSDSEIWLWMEEVKESNLASWSLEKLSLIAHKIGLFHGGYATGEIPLPKEEWVCQEWLASWVAGCDQYAPDASSYYPIVKGRYESIDKNWNSYLSFRQHQNHYFHILKTLPRVVSHHDLSKQNMYMNRELTVIDWQYFSVSGLGEDLGKMFGVAISNDDISIHEAWYYQERLFDEYLEGLRLMGWKGNPLLPKLGFYLSVAFRSAWEMPKLMKLLANSTINELDKVIEKYMTIVEVQMRLAEEADRIIAEL
ncbi:hypothetical protein H8S33_04945 [Ornithinibacillus sp. BX22]|uniref:Aminoglycoside phosphotransferase domain-containing protein n=1 Tax=Ornithinibacillus hominis TaxID=2763055 RepID=A0A923RHK0_9BACI|nr:hypothetical protein [Ornithinibacillus hominis]MBC5636173.1 hypothetical protein [Ornithinibacillus hominis]